MMTVSRTPPLCHTRRNKIPHYSGLSAQLLIRVTNSGTEAVIRWTAQMHAKR